MATKKISELTAVANATGADTYAIVQSGVTYKATRAQNASKGADIASAATTDIGAATGEYVEVTGTTTITALGTVAAGTKRVVRFVSALTLTHNATSLILPTSANITTAADDIAEFISLGSGNWLCTRYSRKNGRALAITTGTETITMTSKPIWEAEGAAVASAATTEIWSPADGNTIHITGTTTITSFGTAAQAGAWMKVIFDGALTLTHGANLNLPGSANITTAANDWAYVYADTTTLFRVLYFRANGTSPHQPSFSVHKNTSAQSGIVTGTPTKVTWGTEDWDLNANFASSTFTPTVAGKYHFDVNIHWQSFSDGAPCYIMLYKNGTVHKESINISGSAATQGFHASFLADANGTTDAFDIYVQHNTGADKAIDGAIADTWWMGHKVN